MRLKLLAPVLVALACAASATAFAKPTPVPGGANQAEGVPTTFGQAAFNGEVRLTPRELRDAKASDNMGAPDGMKWIIFTATASNGTKSPLDMQQFVASIVNANGESFAAQPDKLSPTGGVYGIAPGAGWREQVKFDVPSDFVPAKIILLPYDKKHKAFRITVRPADYKPSTP
ncbi:MAG TPA: hypothetical protein VGC96_07180 [Candidatus Elarobacter sp.]|jgi:hypothetical protein